MTLGHGRRRSSWLCVMIVLTRHGSSTMRSPPRLSRFMLRPTSSRLCDCRAAIRAIGVTLFFLPPCTSGLKLIEKTFAKTGRAKGNRSRQSLGHHHSRRKFKLLHQSWIQPYSRPCFGSPLFSIRRIASTVSSGMTGAMQRTTENRSDIFQDWFGSPELDCQTI